MYYFNGKTGLAIGENGKLIRIIFNSFDKIVEWKELDKKDLTLDELKVYSMQKKPTILGYNYVLAISENKTPKLIPTKAKVFVPLKPTQYVNFLRNFNANLPFPPTSVDLDISDSCTEKCTFCYSLNYRELRAEPINSNKVKFRQMPINTIRSSLIRLKEEGTVHIRLLGGGEPMMHPQFKEIVMFAKLLGFIVTLYTNGNLVTYNNNAEVIASSVDFVRISMNSGSESSRQSINCSSNLKFTLNNVILGIEEINKFRRIFNRQDELCIGCSFLIQPQYIDEMNPFVDLVAPWVDFVTFQVIYGKQSKTFSNEEVDNIRSQISNLNKANFKELNIYYSSRLRNLLENNSTSPIRNAQSDWKYCLESYSMPIYEADGSLQICSNFRGSDDSDLQIGKTFDINDFLQAWYKHSHSKRAFHHEAALASVCKDCCSFTVNLTLNSMLESLREDSNTDFLVVYDLPAIKTNLGQKIF